MDRPVSYHADFAKAFGSVTAGLFLCQAIYWTGKSIENDWFYKSRDDWKNELGMSRKEQESARKKLRKMGALEEELRGLPARLYYRVNFGRLIEIMEEFYNSPETLDKSSWPESDQLDGTKVTNLKDQKSLPYNTEITTESTTYNVVVEGSDVENLSNMKTASSSIKKDGATFGFAANTDQKTDREEETTEKPAWEKIREDVRAVAGSDISVGFAREVGEKYPPEKYLLLSRNSVARLTGASKSGAWGLG